MPKLSRIGPASPGVGVAKGSPCRSAKYDLNDAFSGSDRGRSANTISLTKPGHARFHSGEAGDPPTKSSFAGWPVGKAISSRCVPLAGNDVPQFENVRPSKTKHFWPSRLSAHKVGSSHGKRHGWKRSAIRPSRRVARGIAAEVRPATTMTWKTMLVES